MGSKLFGKRVAVSGRFSTMTSAMVKLALEQAGVCVVSKVTKTTALLVAGVGRSAQHRRAEALGIPIIEEHEFASLLAKLAADPFSTGPAKERSSSCIHMLWEGEESTRSTDWPQTLDWEAVLRFYLDPGELQNERAAGWSPIWFNPYQRIHGCALTASGVILTIEGDGRHRTPLREAPSF